MQLQKNLILKQCALTAYNNGRKHVKWSMASKDSIWAFFLQSFGSLKGEEVASIVFVWCSILCWGSELALVPAWVLFSSMELSLAHKSWKLWKEYDLWLGMTCSQIVKLKFPKAPLHLLIFPIPFSDRELAKLVNVATTRGQIFQESSHFLNPPYTQKKFGGSVISTSVSTYMTWQKREIVL